MKQYNLSNRHRKELLVRGRPLEIAVPAPWLEPEDCVEWARDVFSADAAVAERITDAWEDEITILPGRGQSGLKPILGQIYRDDTEPTCLYLRIMAIIVQFEPIDARQPIEPLQWPVSAVDDDGHVYGD